MKTRLETLESIRDSLLEEAIRLEIASRNLDDRKDDDVIISRLSPFSMEGQKTKKELAVEFEERKEKVEHAIETTEKLIKEEHAGKSEKESAGAAEKQTEAD